MYTWLWYKNFLILFTLCAQLYSTLKRLFIQLQVQVDIISETFLQQDKQNKGLHHALQKNNKKNVLTYNDNTVQAHIGMRHHLKRNTFHAYSRQTEEDIKLSTLTNHYRVY